MKKSRFGEHLKRERELRGISRDEICAATRIGARFLDALENEDWEILPGGIFNRGFIRGVARFLGLDEDDLLAEYDQAVGERDSLIAPSPSPPVAREPQKKRVAPLVLLGTLCVTILLSGGWLAWNWHYKGLPPAGERSSVAIADTPNGNTVNPSAQDVSGTAPAGAPLASPSATQTQPLELKIEAGKETSVTVSADGSKVFEGSIIAGQSRTFTAQEAIDISAKDAGALLLELNGQTLAPLGPPGQPGNTTLRRSDLKQVGGGAD